MRDCTANWFYPLVFILAIVTAVVCIYHAADRLLQSSQQKSDELCWQHGGKVIEDARFPHDHSCVGAVFTREVPRPAVEK